MPHLALHLLGPFQALLDGYPITELESNKVRALLAYLAVEADRPHSRDEVVGLLWPDQRNITARNNLRQVLANLRNAIGDRTSETPCLYTTADSIQFNRTEQCSIDVVTFSELLAACRAHVHRRLETCRSCAQRLQQAVELYRGDFLAQFVKSGSEAFEEWALIKRERWHHDVLDALYTLAEHLDRRSEYDRVRHYATRQLELDPWREEAHRQLMRALALSGQRSAALAQFETCRRVLAHELGADPSQETISLQARIKADQLTRADQHHNLPTTLTSFIGRKRELAEIDRLLETPTCRLLTLTGPGGIGKTRLALQAATNQIGLFAHGVWLVELAALVDPALVPQAIASVLDLRESVGHSWQDLLLTFLKSREVLLVLDNSEHLVEICAQLAHNLLRECPHVSILTTSREALKVAGEVVFRVPPLTTPDVQQRPARAVLMQYDAVQLFSERAKTALPSFEVNDINAPAVEQLCRRLDGIPLAIELAAARVRGLTVEQLVQRLDDRFHLLTGNRTALPRHQTLRATIDWSYSLLTVQESTLFRRLSVFAGGWKIEAAEAVCAGTGLDSSEVLDLLLWLMDKSLMLMDECGTKTRYRMLETIREYARGRLEESGEAEAVRQLHAEFFVELAERVHPDMSGDERKAWYARLDAEQDNCRAALGWARATGNAELGLRLVSALGEYWFWWASLWNEGWAWISQFLSLPMAQHFPQARANALRVAIRLLRYLGESAQANRVADESLALFRELGDKTGIAWALVDKGLGALHRTNYPEAVMLFDESVALFREVGDLRGLAWALTWRAAAARDLGQFEEAAGLFGESIRAAQAIGDDAIAGNAYRLFGGLAYYAGDYERAADLQRRAIVLLRKGGDADGINYSLGSLACIALAQGNLDHAASQLEASEAWFRQAQQRFGLCWILHHLGYVRHLQDDDHTASALLCEALALQQQQQVKLPLIESLERCAWIAADLHQPQRAARLFGAAEAARERIDLPLPRGDRPLYDRHLAQARADLDRPTFDAAWAESRALTLERAVEHALEMPTTPEDVAQPRTPH